MPARAESAWWRGRVDGERVSDSLSPTIHLSSLRALHLNGWICPRHDGELWEWRLSNAGRRALNHNPSARHACTPQHPVANL